MLHRSSRADRELAEPQGERRARVACEQESVDVGLRVVRAYEEQTAEPPVYIVRTHRTWFMMRIASPCGPRPKG